MKEILVIITRMSNDREWIHGNGEGWGFLQKETIAFVDGSCEYSPEFPNNDALEELRLIVIRGDGQKIDIVSTILELFEKMKNYRFLFLFHPGGGGKFSDSLTENKLKQGIESNRHEKWGKFQENVNKACSYSIGAGGKAGAMVRNLITYFRGKQKEEFNYQITNLVKYIDLNEYDDYEEFKNEKEEFLVIPIGEVMSKLKHRASHLFSPIDMDFQGLWDEAVNSKRGHFNINLWSEVVNAYKNVNWEEYFTELENMEIAGKKVQSLLADDGRTLKVRSLEILKSTADVSGHENAYKLLAKTKGVSALRGWLEKLDEVMTGLLLKRERNNE